MPTELTCKELVELVTDYFEEKLPASDRQRFEAHLTTCRGCQAYLQQMQQTLHLLGHLTEEEIPTETSQALLKMFRDWNATAS
jgi:anti-sigma factor RsiW